MRLTKYEEEMMSGVYGDGTKMAMEILVKMGELYNAEYLIPVKRAHIDAAAYTTIWDAGIEFIEYLADNGAKCAVPTTINPLSRDIKNWKELGQSEEFAMKSKRLEDAYMKMGVIPTWTCAPYQCTNAPQFGEVCSWSESNAVDFVNSVLGARAERTPDLVDVCCAVTGRVPAYGRYLDENRAGDMLFKLEGFSDKWFNDSVDFAILGYYVGEIAINKNPVIEGLPVTTNEDNLKALSAAAASGGAVALFHAVGLTPEAPTTEAAFMGKTDYETYIVTPEDLNKLEDKLNTAENNHVDMVLVGCPHLSASELSDFADKMKGKHVADGTDFWLMTNETNYALVDRLGKIDWLLDAGVEILRDTCVMEMDEDNGRWTDKVFVTNSGKVAQYSPSINYSKIRMASDDGCVEAAITGRFPKEVR